MPSGDLRGLPALMTALVEFPPADEVLTCLVQGPFAGLKTHGAGLLVVRDDELVMVASMGYSDEETEAFLRIPLTVDIPLTQCIRDLVPTIVPRNGLTSRYPAIEERSPGWSERRGREAQGQVLAAPITSEGVAIGALVIAVSSEPEWTAPDLGFIDALSSVLGLWLSNPDAELFTGIGDEPPSPTLTTRQRSILRLVLNGRSNAAIASLLHCSVSTVKQELATANLLLETHDRISAAQRAYALGLLADQVLA